MMVRQFQARLEIGENLTSEAADDRPLTIAEGFSLALDISGTGAYGGKTLRWDEVNRARKRIERILGPHTAWANVKPGNVKSIWRTLLNEYSAGKVNAQGKKCGHRQTEVTVAAFYSIAAWLRAESYIANDVGLPIEGWHDSLKDAWQQRTKTMVGKKEQPRHSPQEMAALFEAVHHPDADPRFATAFALGGEQRIGQVCCGASELISCNCRRPSILGCTADSTCRPPGRKRRHRSD